MEQSSLTHTDFINSQLFQLVTVTKKNVKMWKLREMRFSFSLLNAYYDYGIKESQWVWQRFDLSLICGRHQWFKRKIGTSTTFFFLLYSDIKKSLPYNLCSHVNSYCNPNECHAYVTKNVCAIRILWDSYGWSHMNELS